MNRGERMKEFEKWLEKMKEKIDPQDGIAWLNWSSGARSAWEDALVWALKQECYDDYKVIRLNRLFIEKEVPYHGD